MLTLDNAADVATEGTLSFGMPGVSVGGVHGLASYESHDLFRLGLPAEVQSGGGGAVDIANSGTISTVGATSDAIAGLSSGAGEATGPVDVANRGILRTTGTQAHGSIAASRVYSFAGLSGAAVFLHSLALSGQAGNITAPN